MVFKTPVVTQFEANSFKTDVKGGTLEIFVAYKPVSAAESASGVPKGYRMITEEEGAFMWRNSPDFRADIYQNGGIWTGRKGLKSHSMHSIEDNGSFKQIKHLSEYQMLRRGHHSMHFSGKGHVALCASHGLLMPVLVVGAVNQKSQPLYRVAYVLDTAADNAGISEATA